MHTGGAWSAASLKDNPASLTSTSSAVACLYCRRVACLGGATVLLLAAQRMRSVSAGVGQPCAVSSS